MCHIVKQSLYDVKCYTSFTSNFSSTYEKDQREHNEQKDEHQQRSVHPSAASWRPFIHLKCGCIERGIPLLLHYTWNTSLAIYRVNTRKSRTSTSLIPNISINSPRCVRHCRDIRLQAVELRDIYRSYILLEKFFTYLES